MSVTATHAPDSGLVAPAPPAQAASRDCEVAARVLAVEAGRLRLRLEPDPACAGCQAAAHCLLPGEAARVLELSHDQARDGPAPAAGQVVWLAVTPGQRLSAAWWLWLFPTLALLAGASLAEHLTVLAWLGTARAPVAGLVAMALALLAVAGIERRRRGRWRGLRLTPDPLRLTIPPG